MEVGGYYDTYWAENRMLTGLYSGLDALLDAHVPPAGRVLDVGGGEGQTAGQSLAAHGLGYIGVDVSREAVSRAQAAGLEAQTVDETRP